MSIDLMPTDGRVALAEMAQASRFLFALSRGNPAWDGQWTQPNPPAPSIDVKNVLDAFGFARPTLVNFLEPSLTGDIVGLGGGRYAVSAEPTKYLRVRLSLPVGSFAGEPLREIGLFINPVIDPALPAGQTLVPASAVQSRGRLFQVRWDDREVLEDGGFYARNFFSRI